MSQSGIISTSSGPPPPGSVVSLTPDSGAAVVPNGAGTIDVFGGSTSINNTNGIETFNGGANELDVKLTNRANVTATTSDGGGQTQNATLITPPNATALTFKITVTGYDAANDKAIGGEQIGLSRKSGGVVVVVGTNDTFDESDASLNAADWNVIASGADLVMQFVGIAGKSISWRSLFEYSQVP